MLSLRIRLLTYTEHAAHQRFFCSTARRHEIRGIDTLPHRVHPQYQGATSGHIRHNDLLCLRWPSPPRNILLVKKENTLAVTDAFLEYARHIQNSYPDTNIILEHSVAQDLHHALNSPVYTTNISATATSPSLEHKVDLVSTLGGDGTILHAASLFVTSSAVPPLLAFSMGTLGFLGEWKFKDYKRAFREVFMSGSAAYPGSNVLKGTSSLDRDTNSPDGAVSPSVLPRSLSGSHMQSTARIAWSSIRGKSMGSSRAARVLLRNRLKVGLFTPQGQRISGNDSAAAAEGDVYAMNEVIIHRGRDPHLAIVEVYVGGRFLTEAVADGMIISTPTGSTAYNLSSGGSIVHPLVSSLLLTPICPRSLSFRPLVLPSNTPITLRLSQKNRAKEVEVSIDGVRRAGGLSVGMEIRVWGEEVRDSSGKWIGGVPSIVRGATDNEAGEDSWVGGLNGLLKFNYPFGEET